MGENQLIKSRLEGVMASEGGGKTVAAAAAAAAAALNTCPLLSSIPSDITTSSTELGNPLVTLSSPPIGKNLKKVFNDTSFKKYNVIFF